MKDLVLNKKTRAGLELYLRRPTHALMLCGEHGVGLNTIATSLARQIAGANVVHISPRLHGSQKTANINVDDIKNLRQIVRTRQGSALVIVIDEAEQMTPKTPETFLKILEEPNPNIHFILTTHRPEKLPATVLSRVQSIQVLPAALDDCTDMISSEKIPARRQQIEFLAAGRPAEITRLLADDEYFRAQARQFEAAKKFISGKTYDRLALVPTLKTRAEAINFVQALARLVVILSDKQPRANDLAVISDVLDNLHQNGNIKAQMTYLAISL